MKTKLIIALITAFTGLGLFAPSQAEALSGSQFKPGRIIDDAIFFNPIGMPAAQIQTFLNAKVPVCDTNGTKPYNSTMTRAQYGTSKGSPPPYICLKDYRQNTPERLPESGLCGYMSPKSSQTAAQIIHDVANACNINPKVLLVLLQKEQSLVTDDWPWPIQYTKATGFACPDTAPCDPSYAGFFYQVWSAARQFKRYSVDSHLFNYKANRNNNILWHPNTACGSSTVFIENQATAGLYNYTPYRPNQAALNNLYGTGDACSSYGNRNFWRMFNDWFSSTNASYIINAVGTPTLYLQSGNKKFGIPNENVLKAYGFKGVPITSVSSAYLSSLTNGGTLTTVFKFEGSQTVRLADNGNHFGIPNSTTCDNWGLECFDPIYVKELPSFLSALISNGGTLKSLMWTPTDSYSRMQNGKKAPIFGSMTTLGYSATSATPISTPINSSQPYDAPIVANNTLIKFGSSSVINYYNGSNYYRFPSFDNFLAWTRNTSKPVYQDKRSTFANSPPGSSGTLGNFVHNGTAKYFINEGKKFDITALAADWPATIDHAFAAPFLGQLGTATVASNTQFRNRDNGLIYQIKNKKRNYFVSLRDFYASGGSSKPLFNVSNDAVNGIAKGHMLLGEGALFKKASGGAAIYVVAAGNASSYVLTDMGQISRLGLGNVPVLSASSETAAAYPVSGAFADFIKVGSNYYILSRNNKKLGLSAANISRWGINTTDAKAFTAFVGNNIPGTSVEPRFAVAPNGTIYYGYGGQKRPIGSYNKYLQLGGNHTNTFPVSGVFLALMPTGPVMN